MKKLLIIIIIILLLIILLLGGAGFYLYLKFKPFLIDSGVTANQSAQDENTNTNDLSSDKNPLLNEQQEKTLEQIGIDPAKLPTEITPQLEACFISKLGANRVTAIKGGEQPTTFDFLKVQSCLNN